MDDLLKAFGAAVERAREERHGKTTYLVSVDLARVPDVRVSAVDEYDLGHQVVIHLLRHKAIRPGDYDAVVGELGGQITQPLLPRPINFTIRKDS